MAKNLTPILVPDGRFSAEDVLDRFSNRSARIDPAVREFVVERLRAFSGEHSGTM